MDRSCCIYSSESYRLFRWTYCKKIQSGNKLRKIYGSIGRQIISLFCNDRISWNAPFKMCIRDRFYPSGYQKPIRVQGAFVSDEEVSKVVEFLKEENNAEDSYGADIQEKIQIAAVKAATSQERDEYFEKAAEFIIDKDKASIASLQRVFKIGFNRAARLMDQLCEAGIVGEEEGTKPRKVLMSEEQFEQYKEDYL